MSPINKVPPFTIDILQSDVYCNKDLEYKGDLPQYSITNFHIIEVDFYKSRVTRRVPLGLIERIQRENVESLYIVFKIGFRYKLKFSTEDECNMFQKEIMKRISSKIPLYECNNFKNLVRSGGSDIKLSEVDEYFTIISKEFERLQFDSAKWEITTINCDFKFSPTYPKYHIMPKNISKDDLTKMCLFRSQKRFLTVTYRSVHTGALLIRGGQPLIGEKSNRCFEEEFFLKNILHISNNSTKKMVIFDARTKEAALLNVEKGGGTECINNYNMAEHYFLNIPNMIKIQKVFNEFKKTILINTKIEVSQDSDWVLYISMILKSSSYISTLLYQEGRSVLIHCTNGWDRTPQFSSLSKLMIDKFYRTCLGFKVLIEQEWRQLGHKFGERCAIWPYSITKQYSPIFIQWLDCVHQVLVQFPHEFEFNQIFLIKLAVHTYSGIFGNFYGNFMKERCTEQDSLIDIWSYLLSKTTNEFINQNYKPSKDLLTPRYAINDIHIWKELYDQNFEYY